MLVSYNWLKELTDIHQTPGELENILTMLGIEVEGIIDYGKKYDRFVTAEVMNCEKHPDADKLTVCEVTTGKETRSLICGAPNVAAGQKVILGLTGAFVPSAGFTIESRKIRGIKSEGMICSEAELETGEDSSGIWVLPDDTEIGLPLAKYLGLNDVVFDVSLTPNKPDCLSHIGIARDIAAYNGSTLTKPDDMLVESGGNINDSIAIIIEDPEKCPRYTARVVRNIDVKESPEWLKSKLLLAGMRPINVIVDVTNYVMLETGQPLHAFDLDLLEDKKIIVKTAGEKEKFTTLDGKERQLDSQMLMICDGKRSIAIGGVMGGENSEISSKTKNILIESAFFNPSSVRRTSKKLGIQSESSYRFERGTDYENVIYANNLAARLISELTGGVAVNGIIDAFPGKIDMPVITLRYQRAKDIIGENIDNEVMKDMLVRLGFEVLNENESSLEVKTPSWRVDVSDEIDLVEEIARLYNYDNIKPDFSVKIDFSGESIPEELKLPPLRQQIRDFLIPAGYHEIISPNQTDSATSSIFADKVITIANPLGEELSVMRPSVVPALLRIIDRNLKVGNTDLRFFEIGKVFHHSDEGKSDFIPGYNEIEQLSVIHTGASAPLNWSSRQSETDFYDLKGAFQSMLDFMHIEGIRYKPKLETEHVFSKNSMDIYLKKKIIGSIGEVSEKLLKKFDIESNVFLLNVTLTNLYSLKGKELKYKKVSPFPAVNRDLAFLVGKAVSAEGVRAVIQNSGGKYLVQTVLFDVYEGKSIGAGRKSLAFALKFSSADKTLTDNEVDQAIEKIIAAVRKKFSADLRNF